MWIAAGQPGKAALALDKALAGTGLQAEQHGLALLDRARAAEAQGDLKTARAKVNEAAKTISEDPYLWFFSAALAIREDDIPTAKSSINRALAMVPDSPEVLFEAGHVAKAAGEDAKAREYIVAGLGILARGLRDMAGLEQHLGRIRDHGEGPVDRRFGSRHILFPKRQRGREEPQIRVFADRLGCLVHPGAGGLEVALRLGHAGPVEQGEAMLFGLQPGPGQRLVERQRRLARLAGGNPHIAGRGERAVARRIAGRSEVGSGFRTRQRLRQNGRPCSPRLRGTTGPHE